MSSGGVSQALDNKARARYRLTKASVVWIVAALLLVPYELYCIARNVDGGPLTHVVKWAYGPERSPRWWLLGFTSSAFIAWMIPHFLFEGLGLKALLTFLAIGLAVGVTGYLLTR
jgi:hypothetical protein